VILEVCEYELEAAFGRMVVVVERKMGYDRLEMPQILDP
jgi:hypothetical protein